MTLKAYPKNLQSKMQPWWNYLFSLSSPGLSLWKRLKTWFKNWRSHFLSDVQNMTVAAFLLQVFFNALWRCRRMFCTWKSSHNITNLGKMDIQNIVLFNILIGFRKSSVSSPTSLYKNSVSLILFYLLLSSSTSICPTDTASWECKYVSVLFEMFVWHLSVSISSFVLLY